MDHPTVSTCVSEVAMRRYLSGSANDAEAISIEEHFSGCSDCEARAETLDVAAGDTLVKSLQTLVPSTPFIDEPECKQLEEVIGQMGSMPMSVDEQGGLVPGSKLASYRIKKQIGQGGMGTVYLATHEVLEKPVALKILAADRTKDAISVARFQREIRAVGALEHPNIVRATDAGQVDEVHFLAMELVDGVDLAEVIDQNGPLDLADACQMIADAAKGIAHAHRHGLVHRDIKPSNLILTRDQQQGLVKVLDLGLASVATESADPEKLTAEFQVLGTLIYMPPEQASQSTQADQRSDLYSLAATLFHLLTGEPPFADAASRGTISLLSAIANEQPPRVDAIRTRVPKRLADLIAQCLSKNPDDRPADVSLLVSDLMPFCRSANLPGILEQTQSMLADVSSAKQAGRSHTLVSTTDGLVNKSVIDTNADFSLDSLPARKVSPASHGSGLGKNWKWLALASFPIWGLLAGVMFWMSADGTTIQIETSSPEVTVSLNQDAVHVKDLTKGTRYDIEPGNQSIRVRHGDTVLQSDLFEIRRGDNCLVSVRLVDGQIQATRSDGNGETKIGLIHQPLASESPETQQNLSGVGDNDEVDALLPWLIQEGAVVHAEKFRGGRTIVSSEPIRPKDHQVKSYQVDLSQCDLAVSSNFSRVLKLPKLDGCHGAPKRDH